MNELIEELETKWAKCEITLKQAIQTACKAQRNACARVLLETTGDYGCRLKVKSAGIERQDYE